MPRVAWGQRQRRSEGRNLRLFAPQWREQADHAEKRGKATVAFVSLFRYNEVESGKQGEVL